MSPHTFWIPTVSHFDACNQAIWCSLFLLPTTLSAGDKQDSSLWADLLKKEAKISPEGDGNYPIIPPGQFVPQKPADLCPDSCL